MGLCLVYDEPLPLPPTFSCEFMNILVLETGIRHHQLIFSTELQQLLAFSILDHLTLPSHDTSPHFHVSSNPYIQVPVTISLSCLCTSLTALSIMILYIIYTGDLMLKLPFLEYILVTMPIWQVIEICMLLSCVSFCNVLHNKYPTIVSFPQLVYKIPSILCRTTAFI